MDIAKVLQRPVTEAIVDADALENIDDLLLQGFNPRRLLSTLDAGTPPRAVVVRIPTAVAVDLFLCRDRSTALATSDETGKGKLVLLLRRFVWSAEYLLRTIKFILRDHVFVSAGVRLTLPHDKAVVEGIAEHFVYGAQREWPPPHSLELAGSKTPDAVCGFVDFGHRLSGEQQVPHLADEREAVRIAHDRLIGEVVYVSRRRDSGKPALFQLGPVAALHILGEVVDILLCHSEFQLHPELIVTVVPERSLGRNDLLQRTFFQGPDDRSAVDGIPSKTVQLPADHAMDISFRNLVHHLGEDLPTRRLCGTGFGKNAGYGDTARAGMISQLAYLRVDGEDLSILGFR